MYILLLFFRFLMCVCRIIIKITHLLTYLSVERTHSWPSGLYCIKREIISRLTNENVLCFIGDWELIYGSIGQWSWLKFKWVTMSLLVACTLIAFDRFSHDVRHKAFLSISIPRRYASSFLLKAVH